MRCCGGKRVRQDLAIHQNALVSSSLLFLPHRLHPLEMAMAWQNSNRPTAEMIGHLVLTAPELKKGLFKGRVAIYSRLNLLQRINNVYLMIYVQATGLKIQNYK